MTALQKKPMENMLTGQILTGNVLDSRVLEALTSVPRELFVPDSLKGVAYIDEEVPLGFGRFLMQPLVFARMLKYAEILANETVLDVACGTGYSSAVLSKLAQKVVAVEEVKELADKAKSLLSAYANIELVNAPLVQGSSSNAPYDVIFIEGAVEVVPQTLIDQLREGGRVLAVEHKTGAKLSGTGLGKLVEYRKVRGSLGKTVLHDANVALLAPFKKAAEFKF